jgi:phosphoglycerol geranylgeranyltransferase
MTGLEDIARRVEQFSTVARIASRTLLSLDTNPVPADWTHITKIDPEDEKKLPLLYPLYLQHTSALEVGGSRDVTDQNTAETLDLVADRPVPAFQEPSGPRQVTDDTRSKAEFLAIPEVLNGDVDALIGELGRGVEYMQREMAPEMIAEKFPISPGETIEKRLSAFAASWMLQEAVFEAYIIMNLDSAAARESNVTEGDLLDPKTAKQRAMAAERHLGSELVYLEYSGTFGGEEAEAILEAVDDGLEWSRLWYGGGLDDRDNARAVLDAGADAVVVGNVFHEIAGEEADLLDAARDEYDGAVERAALEDWIEDRVEPADTFAAQFLSTATSVPDPERRAVRYLAAGVEFGLELDATATSLDEPSAAEVRSALGEGQVPGETAFADAMGGDGSRALARRLGESLLTEKFGVESGDGFESRHLAVEL